MNLIREAEEETREQKNSRMKAQLQIAKLQSTADSQQEQINQLKRELASMKSTLATMIRKLGPR